MFNPVPEDAPEFFTTKAHFINVIHNISTRGADDVEKTRSRFYIFSIGRSVKNYLLMDKYLDDTALNLLMNSRKRKKRLVIKGYVSPASTHTAFVTLTHIGIYHKPNRSEYQIFNPETGELGYYQLKAK